MLSRANKKALIFTGVIFLLVIASPAFIRNQGGFGLQSNFSGTVKSESSVLIQGEEKQDYQSLCLVQENTIAPIASPQNANAKTFGSAADGGQRSEIMEYIVIEGDTIDSIAKKFNLTANTIIYANNLSKGAKLQKDTSLIILPVDGVIYFVREGDTLTKVAKNYGVEKSDIIAYNELDEEGKLYPGDVIIIPGTDVFKRYDKGTTAAIKPSGEQLPDSYFICPVPRTNGVCQKSQGLHFNNAVDLVTSACCGKPVYAAASGQVYKVKTGYNGGYGNYIKILHPSGITTMYSHLNKIYVKEGQSVSTGDIIGLIGNTGRTIGATGCHLHFEVGNLVGKPPINPFK